MEDILRPIYQERASQANTIGVLLIEKRQQHSAETDLFDSILLIIVKEEDQPIFVEHYTYNDQKAAMHIVTEAQLKEWMLLGNNRKIFDWLYEGIILFDRNEYIANLKKELRDFPFYGRKIKMGVEFARLIRRYMDGKTLFDDYQYLDAYNHIVHSLHHLARLTIIENGFHPEVTVWTQVKRIDPEIYKLYEELVSSEETMQKRLELLFLASEFLIHSRTQIGSSHLLSILSEREIWTFNQMMEHPEFSVYSVDLEILIEYLIEKKFISVVPIETKGKKLYQRCYKVTG
ncbi:nucleotidyltransferase-like protein [Mesobacillus maritimus]|uniref:nucleotidyltransferase-like protein n=1 Tax=Mesobacillus maritimus TaxID=1643336 RepID=UPI00203B20C6|nr:nucleotidyltransferase-like protein [Mesobacillus maritimus]MCM3585705.1 nucleotidyltransferase-like protein [Mesobacillus maritimus]MCM3669177.1 nucleotidyltransferase-like protein [Mesobacillus maritimus]